jgi:hypothetical protein
MDPDSRLTGVAANAALRALPRNGLGDVQTLVFA